MATEERVARLGEEDARRILMRASKLDAQRSGTMTPEELRDIAAEAGISNESFVQALRDVTRGKLETIEHNRPVKRPFYKRFFGTAPLDRAEPVKPSLLRSIAGVVVGGLIGVSAGFVNGFDAGAFAGFLVLILGSLHLVSYHRHNGSNESFQLELLSLWMGYTAMFGMITQDDAAIVFAFGWLAFASLGGVAIAMSRRMVIADEEA